MPLPNFIVIGAPKAGTTTLWALLKQNPDVFMCDPKEPEFFSRDDIYSRGLGWYEKLFEAVKTESAIGEATTAYSRTQTFPQAAERMTETLPQARLIYIVRDPVERLKSDWLWHLHRADVRNKKVPRDFKKALKTYPRLLDASLYWETIEAYHHYRDNDLILPLFFRDLTSDPQKVLEECFEFLCVDPEFDVKKAHQRRKSSGGKQMQRPIVRKVKAFPVIGKLIDLVPGSIKEPIKEKYFWTDVPPRPVIDDMMKSWLKERLKKDIETFLNWAGKPSDYWSF